MGQREKAGYGRRREPQERHVIEEDAGPVPGTSSRPFLVADSPSRLLSVMAASSRSVVEGVDEDDQYHSYNPGAEEDAKGKPDPHQPMNDSERVAY
jgi:hypothetical protein